MSQLGFYRRELQKDKEDKGPLLSLMHLRDNKYRIKVIKNEEGLCGMGVIDIANEKESCLIIDMLVEEYGIKECEVIDERGFSLISKYNRESVKERRVSII